MRDPEKIQADGLTLQMWRRGEAVACGQWPVGEKQWPVVSGQSPVGKKQWPVACGEEAVASRLWPVASGEKAHLLWN